MRVAQTGSVSRLRPAVCRSKVLWPTSVARTEPSATLAGGFSPMRPATSRGQGGRRRVSSQRQNAAARGVGRPLRL
jgi:hypothetical protein